LAAVMVRGDFNISVWRSHKARRALTFLWAKHPPLGIKPTLRARGGRFAV
jgi:hypothetical protein